LGPAAIALNGDRVSADFSAKPQALVGYLAVTGRSHIREKLASLLWGDKPEARAQANQYKLLSTLRQLFGDALIVTRQTFAFKRDGEY
jgi:DNA-binding SARP family transcriptional activator